MKIAKSFLTIACLFMCLGAFAQSPNAIEADLLKAFNRIDHWVSYQRENRDSGNADSVVSAYDSLENANVTFGEKLKYLTEKHPSIIVYPLTSLKKAGLDIFTSSDKLFRIYSWDTWLGGTMHSFNDVMQFKTRHKTYFKLFTNESNGTSYSNLYTFKNNDNTYYLAVYGGSESTRYFYAGIKIFAIENEQLREDVKIIKTKSGLQNHIDYELDFSFNESWDEVTPITFDPKAKTIKIPIVTEKGKVTKKFIYYKFTGKYFEKVK